jgi:hypothetical protein
VILLPENSNIWLLNFLLKWFSKPFENVFCESGNEFASNGEEDEWATICTLDTNCPAVRKFKNHSSIKLELSPEQSSRSDAVTTRVPLDLPNRLGELWGTRESSVIYRADGDSYFRVKEIWAA